MQEIKVMRKYFLTSHSQVSMEDLEDVRASGLLFDGDLVQVSR